MEIEDDLFFQDLSKQISLLIMDDDEDPVARCPSVSLQVLLHVHALLLQKKEHVFLLPSFHHLCGASVSHMII